MDIKKYIVIGLLSILTVCTIGYSIAHAATVLFPSGGGTGWGFPGGIQTGAIPYGNGTNPVSTTTQGTGGFVLAWLNGIPTWTATSSISGSGSAFPFTSFSWGNSTSTTIGFTSGIISNASSTFPYLGSGLVGSNNGRLYGLSTSTLNASISGNAATVTTNANLSGAVTSSGSNVTSFGSQTAGVLGNAATGNTAPMATSTLYGTGIGGQVLAWNNGVPSWVSTSTVFTLTTSGTSGAATYSAGTLNIPQYSGGGGSGTYPFTPSSYNGIANSATTTNLFLPQKMIIASSTYFTNASTSNFEMRLYANEFPGADIGVQTNNAYAALPVNGGIIYEPCGSFSFATAMSFTTNNKPVAVIGCGADSTLLTWTGQATSTIMNTGQSGDMDGGLRDMTLTGTSTTDRAPGIEFGGSNGYAYGLTQNVHITKLGSLVTFNSNSYIDTLDHVLLDFGTRAFGFDYSTNAGENISVTNGSVIADNRYFGGGSTYQHCVDLIPNPNQGAPTINFTNTSFDKCQVYVGPEVNAFFNQDHFEELSNSSGGYTHLIVNGDDNTSVSVINSHFLNGNDSTHSPQAYASTTDGAAFFLDDDVSEYGGTTPTYFDSNTGTSPLSFVNVFSIANTGYTTLEQETAPNTAQSSFSNGVLGLGTTTPGSPLSIGSKSTTQGINLTLSTSTFTNVGGINLTTGCFAIGGVCISGSNGSGTNFWTSSGGNIYNNTGTNVGVGTTSPFAIFSVSNSATTPLGTNLFAIGSTTAGTSTTTPFTIGSTGTVSIDTSGAGPTDALDIKTGTNASAINVTGLTSGTAFLSTVTTGKVINDVSLSTGTMINCGGLTTSICLADITTANTQTTNAGLSITGNAPAITGDRTGAYVVITPGRTMTAAATRTESGGALNISIPYSTGGAVASIYNITGTTTQIVRTLSNGSTGASSVNAKAPVLSVVENLTNTTGTTDTVPVFQVEQLATTSTGGGMSLVNNGTGNLATFTGTGNFGIGTTSPFASLSVNEAAGVSPFTIGSSTATNFKINADGSTEVGSSLRLDGTAATNKTSILDVNGNPAINIQPIASAVDYLDVQNNSSGNDVILTSSSTANGANVGFQFRSLNFGGITFRPGSDFGDAYKVTTAASNAAVYRVDTATGHQYTARGAASLPVCTTNCTFKQGDDNNFMILTGSSVSTSLVTFANAWQNDSPANITPICTASEENAGVVGVNASSTPTTVTLEYASALTTKLVAVHCSASDAETF